MDAGRWAVVLVGVAAVACAPPSSPEPAATVVLLPPPSPIASTPVAGGAASARPPPPPVAPDPLCGLARERRDLETQIDADHASTHLAELMLRLTEVESKICDLVDGSTSPCAEPCRIRQGSGRCFCEAGDPLCSCL
jgi:hypothetical protein